MVTRSEARQAVMHLSTGWAKETGWTSGSAGLPSFGDFGDWVNAKGYGQYLTFRSGMGSDYDVEQWFDQALKQTWRN